MLASFYFVLPLGPLIAGSGKRHDYEAIDSDDQQDEEDAPESIEEHDGMLSSSMHSASGRSFSPAKKDSVVVALKSFQANLRRARELFFP
jgi:battenin